MHFEGIPAIDAVIMEFVQTHCHNPVTDPFFTLFTHLGEAGLLWIGIGIVMLFFRKSRKAGFLMLVAMLCTFLLGELGMKNLVCRPRPCNAFPDFPMHIQRPTSFSFPSGHSSSSFAAATVLFLWNKKWGWVAYFPAAIIAFSRVLLFVHYPTDVFAGVLLGIVFGLLTWQMAKRLEAHRRKIPETKN